MCDVMELTKAKRRIKELEFENDLLRAKVVELQTAGLERPSPQGFIDPKSVFFFKHGVEIKGEFVQLLPTGSDSMDPLFDIGDILIGTEDFDRDKLIAGDIVAYHRGGGHYVVHRIKEITVDEQGRLYKLEGDNNAGQVDPYLVRNEHIKYYVHGVIYCNKRSLTI